MKKKDSNTPTYTVKLSNNLIWSFSSETEELKPWLKKIGIIFELVDVEYDNAENRETPILDGIVMKWIPSMHIMK